MIPTLPATANRAGSRIRRAIAWGLALAMGAMLACGGGIGDPTPDLVTLQGIWQGPVNPEVSPGGQGYLVVLPDQSFRLLSRTGINEVTGNLALNGSSLAGSGTWYTRLDSLPSVPATVSGTATLTPGLVLNLSIGSASNALECALTWDRAANVTLQPAMLAGTYTATAADNSGNLDETLVVAADGLSFTGTNAARSFSGTLAQRQNLNAFDVRGRFAAADPGQAPLAFSGIATYSITTLSLLLTSFPLPPIGPPLSPY